MTRRNLIVIHRGLEYERDFAEIAEKVHALDHNVTIFSVPGHVEGTLPAAEWRHPTLTVALTSKFKLRIKRGPVLQNHQIAKLTQQDIFRKHAIPTPPALPFMFGLTLDPAIFGELVVVKPMDLSFTSQGNLVFLYRRERLCRLAPQDLPLGHPVREKPRSFMVQKYIHTGTQPYCIRVTTFLGKAMICYTIAPKRQVPPLDAPDERLDQALIASNMGERDRRLVADHDAIRLAEAVHRAFGPIPILGVDIIRDQADGKLYVLETNPGGNTWTFASRIAAGTRVSIGAFNGAGSDADEQGRLALIEQFGAFDIVARGLAEKTRELAA